MDGDTIRPIDEQARAEAIDRLRAGFDAGWLTPDEHEHRLTLARRAKTQADLDVALRPGPLPADAVAAAEGPVSPIPPLTPYSGETPAAVTPTPAGAAPARPNPEPGTDLDRPQRSAGLVPLPRNVAQGLVSLSPFVAMAMFFTGHSWLWWLLIPVAGVLFNPGPDGRNKDREERRAQRRALRDARRIRQGDPAIPGELAGGATPPEPRP